MTTTVPRRDDPLGFDVWNREDIDPMGRSATGVELVANGIYHRLTEDQLLLTGTEDDGFTDFGENVAKWVNEPMTQEAADAKAPRLAIVIQRDPRINPASIKVSCDVQPSSARWRLIISITCKTTTEQPISMMIGIDQVTVELLSQGR